MEETKVEKSVPRERNDSSGYIYCILFLSPLTVPKKYSIVNGIVQRPLGLLPAQIYLLKLYNCLLSDIHEADRRLQTQQKSISAMLYASDLIRWLQRKRYQYEVTFSLYMLTPTEKFIFSTLPLSVREHLTLTPLLYIL